MRCANCRDQQQSSQGHVTSYVRSEYLPSRGNGCASFRIQRSREMRDRGAEPSIVPPPVSANPVRTATAMRLAPPVLRRAAPRSLESGCSPSDGAGPRRTVGTDNRKRIRRAFSARVRLDGRPGQPARPTAQRQWAVAMGRPRFSPTTDRAEHREKPSPRSLSCVLSRGCRLPVGRPRIHLERVRCGQSSRRAFPPDNGNWQGFSAPNDRGV